MEDVINSERSLSQPKPVIAKGGDCWACVIGGMTGFSVQDVYDKLNEGEKVASYSCIEAVLYRAKDLDTVKWFYNETPHWTSYDEHRAFGDEAILQRLGWISWVHMALLSGHIGYASVVHNGVLRVTKDDYHGWVGGRTNHAVMICGIRERRTPHKTMKGCARIDNEVLISCSASHPEGKWINVNNFLLNYGGFNPIWVMPNRELNNEDAR